MKYIKEALSNGSFASIVYMDSRMNITKRTIRLGVKKHLKGTSILNRFNPTIITAWDCKSNNYRSFKKDRILACKINGQTFFKSE